MQQKKLLKSIALLTCLFLLAVAVLGCSLILGSNGGGGDDTVSKDPARRSDNIFGIHTLTFAGDDVNAHLDIAHNLVGDGGYVTQMFGPITKETTRPTSWTVEFIRGVYNRNMIPIVRLNMPYTGDYYEPPPTNDGNPATGPEDYSDIASAFAQVVEDLPRKQGRPLYIQLLNEVNLSHEWGNQTPDPVAFGRFIVAAAQAIREIDDPRIVLLSTPLSPQASDAATYMAHHTFLDTMYSQVPESVNAFDALSVHTYPGPIPPEQNNHDGTPPTNNRLTIDAYVFEVDVLKEHGRTDLDVFITETAYQLGNGGLTREQQEEYIVSAYLDYWERWNEVKTVTPYILMSEQTSDWESFEWVDASGGVDAEGWPNTPYPHYLAVAQIEKQPMRAFPGIPTDLGDYNMVTISDSLLFGADVTTSTSIELYGWAAAQINDGDAGGLGWSSDGDNVDEWVVFDLGSPEELTTVVLHPRGGDAEAGKFFPVSFRLESSEDGTSWTEIYSHSFTVDDPETWRITNPHTCNVDTTSRYLRLYVTEKTNHGGDGYHVQLSEVEAF
jgi:hypothetical protein